MKTVAFEQLCAFAAIRDTSNAEDVLRNVVVFIVELFSDHEFTAPADVATAAADAFGLSLSEARIQSALDSCIGRGMLVRKDGTYQLSQMQRTAVLKRLEESRALETRVRTKWLAEVRTAAPDLQEDVAWRVLEGYSTKLFRQHGLQTMALVDPMIDVPDDLQVSLRSFLDDELNRHCPEPLRPVLRNLVEGFFAGLASDSDRVSFIVQIADSVVSFYALAVRPEMAARLTAQLEPLTLFLDTNVLFGLVGLDDGHLVDVSHELVDVVVTHDLPLKLRYHEATAGELRNTFDAVTSRLMGSTWSPAISRAAAKSSRISTIQRLYHERNAERPITPQTYFAPFEHMDVLIQEKGIKIYREAAGDRQSVYDLIQEYTTFLQKHGRDKKYEAVDHDMTLLYSVRRQREKAENSLQAKALLVTYDFFLHRYDWVSSRRRGDLPCTVLPNQLLQLLRPYLPITDDFDRSFAETFAVPEFRAMGGGSQVAAARMLQLLASYEGISESTAEALLANDMLLRGLNRAKSDAELREYVDSAIAAQNAVLVAEKDELEQQLATERESATEAIRLERQRAAAEERLRADLRAKEETTAALKDDIELEKDRVSHAESTLLAERGARESAELREKEAKDQIERLERRIDDLEEAKARADERGQLFGRLFIATVIAGLLIAIAELSIRLASWSWLLQHDNSYGLRGAAYVVVAAGAVAVADRRRRRLWLTAVVGGAVVAILQLLGGSQSGL